MKSRTLRVSEVNSANLAVKGIIMVVAEINALNIALFGHCGKFAAVFHRVCWGFFHKAVFVYLVRIKNIPFSGVISKSLNCAFCAFFYLNQQIRNFGHGNVLNNY